MGLARKPGRSVCFAFYQERFFAAAEKTRFQCRERSAHRPVDLQNAGDLMELVHESGQLRSVLNLNLDADDGEAVLRAAGVQAQHKGLGGGQRRGNVQQQVQPVLADRLDGGGIAVIGIGAPGDLDPAVGLLRSAFPPRRWDSPPGGRTRRSHG